MRTLRTHELLAVSAGESVIFEGVPIEIPGPTDPIDGKHRKGNNGFGNGGGDGVPGKSGFQDVTR